MSTSLIARIRFSSAALFSAPGWLCSTIPSRMATRVGMALMLNERANSCWASVSTLPKDDVGIALGHLVVDGAELFAGPTPLGPEIDEHGRAGLDGRREIVGGEFDGRHPLISSTRTRGRGLAGALSHAKPKGSPAP